MKFATLLSTLIPLVILQNDDLEKVSNSLKVTHYDCSSMQENKMYALNQMAPKIKLAQKTFTLPMAQLAYINGHIEHT